MNKLIVFIILFSFKAYSQEIDYLKLANLFILDGALDKAQSSLIKAKQEWEYIDHSHYYLLEGLLELRQKNYDKALLKFALVKDDELLNKRNIYQSQAYFEMGEKERALKLIQSVKISKNSQALLLKIKILFQNDKIAQAFSLFDTKMIKNLEQAKMMKILYAFDLGLYERAFDYILSYTLDRNDPLEYIKFSKLLISKKQMENSFKLLDIANIKHPFNTDLIYFRAAALDLLRMPFSAGNEFIKLSYLDPSYSFEAAEYLKTKNRYTQANIMNMTVIDSKKQVSQKLALYIENERFDLAQSLESSLKQYGVYRNDEIKYAMAYSYFQNGNYEYSQKLLRSIKNTKLVNKSLKLLEVASECQQMSWSCYGTL